MPWFELTHKGKKILVGCAVGHLFGLAETDAKGGFRYPVFDIEWKPVYEVQRGAAYARKYAQVLTKLAKQADSYTLATDYDTEGEVIGINIIRYICHRNDARRMKFSTLTKPDLIAAYENASKTLDWGQVEAGETRHYLDYYYGINISRALTTAIKKAGIFKILSTGRVQGPTLKIVVDREREIAAFKPVPFWLVKLDATHPKQKQELLAEHIKGQFWKEDEAKSAFTNAKKAKHALVDDLKKSKLEQRPPTPFDLTTLQTEAYRWCGTSPKITLGIAQDLYTQGVISYPRTSSQKLSAAIGYAKIIKQLGKQTGYAKLAEALLKKKSLRPNEGGKTDPAHPAIYPTGQIPKGLDARHQKVYDLVVKRFLATFADPALRETVKITLDANKEQFVLKGSRTIEPGWHVFYAPYVKLEEAELPPLEKGEKLSIKQIDLLADQTKPPKRYTPSSLVRELEKRNLGTKATRAETVDTLYRRNYTKEERITVTELGMHTIEILEKYCPKIIDEELTKHFELDMEAIREHKKKRDAVLKEARSVLKEILTEFKGKEKEIGEGLKKTFAATEFAMAALGPCPKCKKGTIVIKRGKFGRFGACNRYPDCSTTFALPRMGYVSPVDHTCKDCDGIMIKLLKKGTRPRELCLNPDCPKKAMPELKGEHICPKCNEGKLVIRKSVYGSFIACNRYPKCKYVQKSPPMPGKGTAKKEEGKEGKKEEKQPAATEAEAKKPAAKKPAAKKTRAAKKKAPAAKAKKAKKKTGSRTRKS